MQEMQNQPNVSHDIGYEMDQSLGHNQVSHAIKSISCNSQTEEHSPCKYAYRSEIKGCAYTWIFSEKRGMLQTSPEAQRNQHSGCMSMVSLR